MFNENMEISNTSTAPLVAYCLGVDSEIYIDILKYLI
jgi:hypothetical protein